VVHYKVKVGFMCFNKDNLVIYQIKSSFALKIIHHIEGKFTGMIQRLTTLTFLLFLPSFIFAHGSHGSGIMAGFTHPILGIDHNVAILGTGILGYLIDQKKWYLAPLAFIVAMIVGGFMGVDKEATFFVEKTIAFSVLSIGFLAAFYKNLNVAVILALFAVFGGFHGYAHGAEMPETNTVFKYIPGYTLGAILLAIIGFFIGKVSRQGKAIHMISGILIGCGIMMLLP